MASSLKRSRIGNNASGTIADRDKNLVVFILKRLIALCVAIMVSSCSMGFQNSTGEITPPQAGMTDEISPNEGEELGGVGTSEVSEEERVWAQNLRWVEKATDEGGSGAWIEIGLDGLGLISPPDGSDEMLPTGESICSFQAPMFVLEHPMASRGLGADERSETWRGD